MYNKGITRQPIAIPAYIIQIRHVDKNQKADLGSLHVTTTAPPPLDVSQPAFHLEDLPSRLPSPSTSSQKHPPPSNSFTHYLHLHTHLTLFSLLGTLTRLGLLHLTTYPSAPLPPLFWPQFAGSLIMGFLLEDKSLLFPTSTTPSTAKTSMPLYLGLTSGYCGSVTAFSSFMLGAFDELSNMGQSGRGRKRRDDVAAMLAYVIGTLAVSLAGLQVGAHLAVFARGVMPTSRRGAQVCRWIDILAMPLSLALWIAATLMSIFIKKWRGNVLLACVFSPPGAILRFWISRWGNPVRKSFPLGTFMVNMLGTAVLAGLLIGRYAHSGGGGDNTCGVLRGLGDGFCGCLTTVSTFVVEIRGLMTGHTYIYAGASIVVGLCLMILILGSYARSDMLEINGAVDFRYLPV
ncbi:hypothetical protein L873DRAFT_1827821 [Choiromyces venosus 120613-1]|uniref:CRCB-domain-containing protein n=1 Tax=Choiromyces venosus 120613-1 TaxID=1336337 RepID=A0A3N4JRG4_9PEZI|nr:hypothetical protein L873DRAFT_1827821 [Choiromyces venosus 120613-1]